jgi:ribosomal protein S18 acetylase RimI-like enzyme
MSNHGSVVFRVAAASDRCEIERLFADHFYRSEPFNVGWINDDIVPEDREAVFDLISHNLSIVAVDESTNRIVGACIANVDMPDDIQAMQEEAERTESRKWSQYLQLFIRIARESNLFERLQVREIFHVNEMAVDANYRNQSIGRQLIAMCQQHGAALGYKVCSVNCSSVYTERIATKLGMECMSAIAMDSVMDENGERLIYPPAPHTHIRTYAKRLCNDD